MFFSNRKYADQPRTAPVTHRVTPTLSVSVWEARDMETGRVRMHWQVIRNHPENPSVAYKTLRLESLLEFPEFLARIAAGFARAPGVPEKLREELLDFSKQQAAIVEFRKADGLAEPEKAEGDGGLNCVF